MRISNDRKRLLSFPMGPVRVISQWIFDSPPYVLI